MNIKVKALLAVLLVLLGVSTASTAFAQESEAILASCCDRPKLPRTTSARPLIIPVAGGSG